MAYDLVVAQVSLIDGRSADIGINGQKIDTISPAGSLTGEIRIDGKNGLCTRPLSDGHIHLDKAGTVQAGVHPPSSINEAIAAMRRIKKAAANDPAEVERRMAATLRRLHRNGTRFIRALVDVDETWGLTGFKAALKARKSVPGLAVKLVAFAQEGMSAKVADLLTEAAKTGADAIGGHTDVDKDPRSHIRTAVRIAREASLPLEVHVDEAASAESFKMPMVLEEAYGLPELTLVHCLSLACLSEVEQERWIAEVKRSGATVVAATSVLLFGLPLAPLRKIMKAGVPVGLGSDNLQDVFVPLGTGRLLETARTTAVVAGLATQELLNRVLESATEVGYQLVTGAHQRLEAGSNADLIVFSGSSAPAVMFGEDRISLTVIGGKPEEVVES